MNKDPRPRANHKGNIKFPNPLLSREAYQIREGEKEDENLQMWRLFSMSFSSYILEKFTIYDKV
jgi:hypothetical protein